MSQTYSTYYKYKDGLTGNGGVMINSPSSTADILSINSYQDRFVIPAPFDVLELTIGSYKVEEANWTNISNAPTKLPTGGHFHVFIAADTSKTIQYVVDVADAVKDACFTTRSASLVITDEVAEAWVYLAQGETMDFGKVRVASKYDQGRATELKEKVYNTDFIDETASLNRGSKSGKIDFNKVLAPGDYDIEWSADSKHTPLTTNNKGRLHVEATGCVVSQSYYPYDTDELLFRERSDQKVWTPWFVATAGDVLVDDKVKVPTYYRQGRPSGYAFVEIYSTNYVDSLTTSDVPEGSRLYFTTPRARGAFSAGTGINISEEGIISYTGLTTPISAGAGISYNSGTGVISSTITQYTDAMARGAISPGTGISYNSSTGVISWSGSTTPIAGVFPIVYNGTTGDITWNGTTTDVPEGTNLYWTTARGDARYPQLSGTYSNPSWITSLAWSKITGAPTTLAGYGITDAYTKTESDARFVALAGAYANPSWITSLAYSKITGVPDFVGTYVPLTRSLTVAGTTSNIVVTGGAQTLAADRTWTVNLAALHASPLSGGSATQVPYFTTDIYGRVTGISNVNITFPVTSVNGQTGAVVLTTSNIAEGANLYWTTARGDARYSLLGHTHTYADITGKPLTFNPASHTHPYTEVTGITAGTGITYSGGVIATTITQYTNAMAQAAELDPFGYAWHYFGVSGTQITLEINRRNSTTGYASFNIPALPISHITSLQSVLDGKTPWGHTHAISDVTGLQSALDGKTPYGHTHDDRYYTEGEVNSLLSGKSNTGHGHWYTDISGAPWLTSESDPYGVNDMWLSYIHGTLSVNIQLRNSSVITRTVFLGGG